MKKVLGFFFRPAVLWTLAALCVALIIWFAGPLLAFAGWHPLETATARIVLIVVLLVVWLGKRIVTRIREKMANRRLVAALAAQNQPAAQPPDAAQAAQLEAVRQRFAKALDVMRQVQPGARGGALGRLFGGRRYVYQLPWYVIIGPPGSGKTTALLHSGLQFPLAEQLGNDPIRGVGGTRNCDWWFTDEAVMIDTAGRYVTQDSDADSDSREWGEFLGQLKRYRTRQPINGALVTVSVSDLLQMPPAEREAQAVAVRSRLQELLATLDIGFPVYLLVTKADLLAGFLEFFDDLDREQREQVWGTTFDWRDDGATLPTAAEIDARFDELVARIDRLRLDRLQAERDPQRRAAIYGFVHQLAAIRPALASFVASAFPATQLGRRPSLRGVYFTSGTQEGSPIDRVMGSLARQFGLQRRMLPAARPSGKSFFLTRVLRDIVFPEAPLAGTNLRWERGWASVRWAATIGTTVVAIGAILAWSVSFWNNRGYVDEVEQKVVAIRKSLEGRVASSIPLKALLPLYSLVRGLPVTDQVDPANPKVSYGWGLFQGGKLAEATDQTYQRLLQQTLAPLLAQRMAAALRGGGANPELQYETLKTYVMLREPDHLDRAAVRGWVGFDVEVNQAGALTADERKELLAHVDAMLERNAFQDAVTTDSELIGQVRATLASTPFPQRVYNRLKREGVGRDFPDFRITTVVGPVANSVFGRASGRPLGEGVPGLYTYDGYHKGFVKALDDVVKALAEEETWVLGIRDSDNAKRIRDPKGREQLVTEVKRLYLLDYASTWERFVADIRVKRGAELGETIAIAKTLSDPSSPLLPLLRAILREVTLTASSGKDAVAQAVDKATDAVKGTKEKLEKIFGQAAPALAAPQGGSRIESLVDDRFAALRAAVAAPPGGGAAPIEKSMALLGELYQHLVVLNEAVKTGAPPPRNDVKAKIDGEAGRLPEPAKGMFSALASAGVDVGYKEQRAKLDKQLRALGESCTKLIGGRYPFQRDSRNDVTPEDFAKVFAGGGLLDDFQQKELAALVDTTVKPWKFKDPAMGDSGALIQFQRAAEIRGVFFGGGARGPSMRIEFKPVEMDPAILTFNLDVDGQVLRYQHGPIQPQSMQWPGPRGSNQIRMQISPPGPSGASGVLFSGAWALFRMFDGAQIEPGVPPTFRATVAVDDRKVVFDVSTSSVQNPFRLADLQQFRCPAQL